MRQVSIVGPACNTSYPLFGLVSLFFFYLENWIEVETSDDLFAKHKYQQLDNKY